MKSSTLIGLISSIAVIICLSALELFYKNRLHPNVTRKIAHILAGFFALGMAYVLDPLPYVVLALGFTALMIITMRLHLFNSIHNVERRTFGAVLLPVGVLIAYLLAGGPSTAFATAVLILTLGDSLASVPGHIIGSTRKTSFGSVIFFVIAFTIYIAAWGQAYYFPAVASALVLTAVEKYSPWGSDNLTLPIVAVLCHIYWFYF